MGRQPYAGESILYTQATGVSGTQGSGLASGPAQSAGDRLGVFWSPSQGSITTTAVPRLWH
jgi:hypothetical protein